MNWKPNSKIIVQGITNNLGSYYTTRMKAYGTNIVAGICPGKGGQHLFDIPIFDLVEEAIEKVGEVETTIIFVAPERSLDAALEAIAAGIKQIIIVSAGIPPLDMVRLLKKARSTGTLILGCGSSGILIPEKMWLGTIEPHFYTPGKVGLISRSHSVCAEVALALNQAQLGQSIVVTLGKQRIIGSSFEQWLEILDRDDRTEIIVAIEHPNGLISPTLADFIAKKIKKPTIAYLAGLEVPIERNYIDALSIVTTQVSYSVPAINQEQKTILALQNAGVKVAQRPSQIPKLIKNILKKN
ncbi:MAG: CoA-binding protein [Prochloraceae cyanobacterium]|nr:CoA-binding protein [Prochloraceae cyanobacterium]